MHAAYFAPRGKTRIIELGRSISHRYIDPRDKLIGLIGDAGAGKSLLIRGIFPGLELTNDDDGINVRPLPLIRDVDEGRFRSHTYHVDVRFELAFNQPWVVAEAVKKAIAGDRRVVLEHFDLLFPVLKINAEVLIGVGEEVIVTRPGVFGPFPQEIVDIVFKSLPYRKMAHSAEDLTSMVLVEMGINKPEAHSDIKHGFVLEFQEKPEIDIELVERKVLELIDASKVISYYDEQSIKIGEDFCDCTGPRLHVRNTGEIKGFRLLKEFKWDHIEKLHILAGFVGDEEAQNPPGGDSGSITLLQAKPPKRV
ncbi:MAG: alanine-tRNA synthetase second additional domain-containing protein [Eubacteriales bacterium]